MHENWKLAPAPKVKPAIDDFVHVVFLDHAENSEDAIRFEVVGRLFDITKTSYRVRCWGYVSDIDRATDNNIDYNEHWFTIVKKAVESIEVLK